MNLTVLVHYANTANALQTSEARVVETQKAHRSSQERVQGLTKEKMDIDSSLRVERLKSAKKDKEIKSLKANLQAKKEAKAKLASATAQGQVNTPAPKANVSGNKASWLAASGIPESQWGHVDWLVSKESGWNPNAVNASSGACGLGQQLPCGKWSGAWNDPVSSLKGMHGYVMGRYGSWSNAVAHSQSVGWY